MSENGVLEEEESYVPQVDDRSEWDVYPQTMFKFEHNTTKVGRGLIFRLSDDILEKRVKTYAVSGMRITVCGVILSHRKGFPFVLLLKRDLDKSVGLLGGKCKSFENPKEVLSSKLARFITSTKHKHQLNIKETIETIQVGELLADFWRCDFNTEPLPYLPLHTNRPKEKISLYQVLNNYNLNIINMNFINHKNNCTYTSVNLDKLKIYRLYFKKVVKLVYLKVIV